MCKKLYKLLPIVFTLAWVFLRTGFAEPAPPPPNAIPVPLPLPAAQSANQKQLTQINALFDKADYMHCENPYNVIATLMLGNE